MTQTGHFGRDMELRRLRYRLRRLGMLELETWLSRLEPALERGDEAVVCAAQQLMEMQTHELLAVMHAESPLPDILRSWLGERPR